MEGVGMSRRIIHDTDFIDYVMTPLPLEEYEKNDIKVDTIKVLNKNRCVGEGLGQLPTVMPAQEMFSGHNEWVMPVVIIVVSAMAFMTLYMVLTKR